MAWTALPVVFGEKFLARHGRILHTIVEAIAARNSTEALIAHLEAISHYPSLNEIAQSVQAPCLVVSGTDDLLVTEEAAQELALLCNGRYEGIAGAGHSVPVEAPELFGKMVLEFLGEA
jgi:pimeloyl-ACP methyl ester carboxylesterase